MATSGAADPTRASIPIHLAVNGSLEVGHTVGIVLAGDATELVKAAVCEQLEGVGVPPSATCSPRPASMRCPSTSERDARWPAGPPTTTWLLSAASGDSTGMSLGSSKRQTASSACDAAGGEFAEPALL